MVKSVRRRGGSGVAGLAAVLRSEPMVSRLKGAITALAGAVLAADLVTYHPGDASLDSAAGAAPANLLGGFGADMADLCLQLTGLSAWLMVVLLLIEGVRRLFHAGEPVRTTLAWARAVTSKASQSACPPASAI